MVLAHLTWPDLGLVAALFLVALVLGAWVERLWQRSDE